MNVRDKRLGAGDIFIIRLRLTGPDDEKNIAAFALREHEQILEGEERLEVH